MPIITLRTNPPANETHSVDHKELSSLAALTEEVEAGDVCIYWYFGSYGLKEGAVDFYRDSISRIREKGGNVCLVDLTAWGSFKSGPSLLCKSNKNADNLCCDGLSTFKTSDFFSAFKNIPVGSPLFNLLHNILSNEALLSASCEYEDVGKTLAEVLGADNELIREIAGMNAAKCYSAIQYIEFLYICKFVMEQYPLANSIRFHLPNDESKYYLDTLQADLNDFFAHIETTVAKEREVTIQVDCFAYGNERTHRPYNSPGKTIKRQLELRDIIRPEEEHKADETTRFSTTVG